MSRVGVLQTDLGSELLAEVKQEAAELGLTASSYVRLLVKRRRFATWPFTARALGVSEKGGPKKATKARAKRSVMSGRRKP
jgi:hypothetical protein